VSYSIQIRVQLKRDLFPSRFQTQRLYAFLNFQMPGYNGPGLSTTMRDFRLSETLFKTQVVIDIKPSDTAPHRLASHQTSSWMLYTISSRFPLGKFVSLMWGSTKIFWDFFMFVSLIHGKYYCSSHILYMFHWSMESNVVGSIFFIFVSLIHGNFCCSSHIFYVCVAYPWKVLL
jgi:hypothetical protein